MSDCMVGKAENKHKVEEQSKEKECETTGLLDKYKRFFKAGSVVDLAKSQPVQPQKEYIPPLDKKKSKQQKNIRAKIVALEERRPHEVKMQDLAFFSQMRPKDILDIQCILEYDFGVLERVVKEKKLGLYFLRPLNYFLECWRSDVGFNKLKPQKMNGDNFVEFCKEILDVFEEFFPLPKKYRLFLNELTKAVYEDKKKFDDAEYDLFVDELAKEMGGKKDDLFLRGLAKIRYEEGCFSRMYTSLREIIGIIISSEYDIFDENNDRSAKEEPFYAFSFLEDGRLKKYVRNYGAFRERCKVIVDNIKKQNIPDFSEKEIQGKLKKLANSAFNKNSNSDEWHFSERMEGVMRKFFLFNKQNIDELSDRIWQKTKDCFVNVKNIGGVCINGDLIPKEDTKMVSEFLNVTPQNTSIYLLKEFDNVRALSGSKIRRDLLFTSTAVACLFLSRNKAILLDFFRQLTQKERTEIMYSEIKWGEKRSIPLLLIFLLNLEKRDITIDFIRSFLPEFFDLRFKIHGEKESHNIFGLLQEIKNFCENKSNDLASQAKSSKEEICLYANLLGMLDEGLVGKLRQIREEQKLGLVSKKDGLEKIRKEQMLRSKSEKSSSTKSEESPSTKIEIGKKRYEESECCIVNLFRCIAARIR